MSESEKVDDARTPRMARRPQLQVLDPVVHLVAVDVMNRLVRTKNPPQMSGHDEAVLGNAIGGIATHTRERIVLRNPNRHVSASSDRTSAFPEVVGRSFPLLRHP